MVGQPRPGASPAQTDFAGTEGPGVDAVERHQRQPRGIGAHALAPRGLAIGLERRLAHIDQALLQQLRADAAVPVVEIARDDERRLCGHLRRDVVEQAIGLALSTGGKQSEMHHDAVQRPALGQRHLHMKQAALLEAVVRYIAVGDVDDGIARQQRIAMLTMPGTGIGAVGRVHVQRLRQKVVLRQRGPAAQSARVALMQKLHLLQKNQIGLKPLQRRLQLQNAGALGRAVAEHAFVDVVGGDAQFHDRACSARRKAPRQLADRVGVRGRKAALGRLLPRQPDPCAVFACGQGDGSACGHFEAEHMLGVFPDARRVAMPPQRIDFVHIGQPPIAQRG